MCGWVCAMPWPSFLQILKWVPCHHVMCMQGFIYCGEGENTPPLPQNWQHLCVQRVSVDRAVWIITVDHRLFADQHGSIANHNQTTWTSCRNKKRRHVTRYALTHWVLICNVFNLGCGADCAYTYRPTYM